jgi:hypothetical protein
MDTSTRSHIVPLNGPNDSNQDSKLLLVLLAVNEHVELEDIEELYIRQE